MIMICQYRLTDFDKGTTPVGAVDRRGGYTCVGTGSIRELAAVSAQFCCEPKTAVKNKILFFKVY